MSQLYGPSGSGKTNISLQLSVECVKSGKKAVYIDTEGFSPERFSQIAGDDAGEIAREIIIYEPENFEQQAAAISDLSKIISGRIGLIVLDSAATFYRFGLEKENDTEIDMRRSLASQIGTLHAIARKHNICAVFTNQVYTDVDTNELCPVGGTAIEHLSKTIIGLERIGSGRRRAVLRKHRSRAEGASCEFQLTRDGVR